MVAVRAMYDGKTFRLLEPAPKRGAAEVIITFLGPARLPRRGRQAAARDRTRRPHASGKFAKYAGSFRGKLSSTDQFMAAKSGEKELDL
jgi:hypothetical protein